MSKILSKCYVRMNPNYLATIFEYSLEDDSGWLKKLFYEDKPNPNDVQYVNSVNAYFRTRKMIKRLFPYRSLMA